MDFALTDEQREIQSLAREFADAEIAPHAADWDREHRFPHEVFAKLAELGLMGVCVPEEYGGAGADFLAYVLVLGAVHVEWGDVLARTFIPRFRFDATDLVAARFMRLSASGVMPRYAAMW